MEGAFSLFIMEISEERYKYLTLCEKELLRYRVIKYVCPRCHNGLIMDGYVCNNCGYGM